jgi:hypothetical protein
VRLSAALAAVLFPEDAEAPVLSADELLVGGLEGGWADNLPVAAARAAARATVERDDIIYVI